MAGHDEGGIPEGVPLPDVLLLWRIDTLPSGTSDCAAVLKTFVKIQALLSRGLRADRNQLPSPTAANLRRCAKMVSDGVAVSPKCPSCKQRTLVRRSHRSFAERTLAIIFLYPFRCERCDCRFYRVQWRDDRPAKRTLPKC